MTTSRQPSAGPGMVGSSRGGHWWLYVILVVALVAVIAPFIWMILGSFKSEGELRQMPPTWWPEAASLDNYTQLFSRLDFGQFFFNSAVVAVIVTVGNLIFCSMLGYALAMLEFKGKRIIFVAVLGTLMIPGVVTFVPLFVLVANAGLVDTLPGLFLPFLVSPFGVFLMRQFILGLPKDLLDAGRIDGAGELRSSPGSSCRCAVLPWRHWASSPSSAAGTTSSGHSSWRSPRTSTRCLSRWRSTPPGRTAPTTACSSLGPRSPFSRSSSSS